MKNTWCFCFLFSFHDLLKSNWRNSISSLVSLRVILLQDIGTKWWLLLVPSTVFDFAKSSSRSTGTLNISSWLTPKNVMKRISLTHRSALIGSSKFGHVGVFVNCFATKHLTNPPTPSHGDLPWLVAKNIHSASILKSCWWWHKVIKFLQFVYCSAKLSEK